jgi:hypothetical protein
LLINKFCNLHSHVHGCTRIYCNTRGRQQRRQKWIPFTSWSAKASERGRHSWRASTTPRCASCRPWPGRGRSKSSTRWRTSFQRPRRRDTPSQAKTGSRTKTGESQVTSSGAIRETPRNWRRCEQSLAPGRYGCDSDSLDTLRTVPQSLSKSCHTVTNTLRRRVFDNRRAPAVKTVLPTFAWMCWLVAWIRESRAILQAGRLALIRKTDGAQPAQQGAPWPRRPTSGPGHRRACTNGGVRPALRWAGCASPTGCSIVRAGAAVWCDLLPIKNAHDTMSRAAILCKW